MKKEISNKLAKDVKKFLSKKGWEVYTDLEEKYCLELFASKLEQIPFPPKYLIEKQGQKLWVYYFWKGAYPVWEGKFQCAVTGIDYHKYDMMKGLSAVTGIPSAIVFDSEQEPEIIFRQLDQLPRPKHSRAPKCDPKYGFNYFKCWKEDPKYYQMLIKEAGFKFKTGMAIWEKSYFGHDTFTQPSLV